MKEYRSDALGRETDFVACYLRYRHRMLYEWLAVAALVLLQSLCCYIVGLQDQLLAGLVIPWEQFVYILSHMLYTSLRGPWAVAICYTFHTFRYCWSTHISSLYFAAARKSSSAAAFSMLRFASSTAFST